MRGYRVAISLGTGCQTAHQIRTWLWQPEAYFFDWLVTPVQGLIELVEHGLMRLFESPSAFVPLSLPTPTRDYQPMQHEELGVAVFHEFAAGEEMADFDRVVSKYKFLAERWYAAVEGDGPVLFVRHLATVDEAAALETALRRAYPHLAFTLLAVNEDPARAEPWELAGVVNTVVGRTPFEAIYEGRASSEAWKGDSEGWLDAFRLVGALP